MVSFSPKGAAETASNYWKVVGSKIKREAIINRHANLLANRLGLGHGEDSILFVDRVEKLLRKGKYKEARKLAKPAHDD